MLTIECKVVHAVDGVGGRPVFDEQGKPKGNEPVNVKSVAMTPVHAIDDADHCNSQCWCESPCGVVRIDNALAEKLADFAEGTIVDVILKPRTP